MMIHALTARIAYQLLQVYGPNSTVSRMRSFFKSNSNDAGRLQRYGFADWHVAELCMFKLLRIYHFAGSVRISELSRRVLRMVLPIYSR